MLKPWVWFCSALLVLSIVEGTSLLNSPWLSLPPKPIGDGPDYENIAFNLSQGNGFAYCLSDARWRAAYTVSLPEHSASDILARESELTPTTARPPLLPWLIAVIYSVLPRGPTAFTAVRILLAVCLAVAGALAVATSVWIMARATKRPEPIVLAGLATLALAASDRTIRTYATDFLTEPIALLLTQLFAMVVLWWLTTQIVGRALLPGAGRKTGKSARPTYFVPRMAPIAVAGVLLALMIYARSLFVFWVPGIWLMLAFARSGNRTGRARALEASTLALLTLVCLAPWWTRNCLVLGRFMPLGTQGPITLLGGYSDEALAAGGDWQLAPELRLRAELQLQPRFAESSDGIARELIVADEAARRVRLWIGNHWSELPRLFVSRAKTHWNPYIGRSLFWKVPMLLGLAWLVWNRRIESWMLIGLPVLNTVVVMLLYTTGGRFLVPLYGILYTLAAIGLAGWLETWLAWSRTDTVESQ